MTDVLETATPSTSTDTTKKEAPVARSTPQLDWRKVGMGGGAAGAFALAAFTFFQGQFGELRDSFDQVSKDLRGVSDRLVSIESSQRREERELQIRLERLEEWRRIIPDGTGTDRWTGSNMVEFSLLLARENPTLKIPDTRAIQRDGR